MRRTITLCSYDLKKKDTNRIMIRADFMICCGSLLLFEDSYGLIARCPDTLNSIWIKEGHEYVSKYGEYVLTQHNNEYFVLMIKSGELVKKLDNLTFAPDSRIIIADKWMIEIANMYDSEMIISSNPLIYV